MTESKKEYDLIGQLAISDYIGRDYMVWKAWLKYGFPAVKETQIWQANKAEVDKWIYEQSQGKGSAAISETSLWIQQVYIPYLQERIGKVKVSGMDGMIRKYNFTVGRFLDLKKRLDTPLQRDESGAWYVDDAEFRLWHYHENRKVFQLIDDRFRDYVEKILQ